MKYYLVTLLFVLFGTTTISAQSQTTPDTQESMESAMKELSEMLDTMDIQKMFGDGFSGFFGSDQMFPMDSLSNIFEESMKEINPEQFSQMMEQGMQMLQEMDMSQFDQMLGQFDFKELEKMFEGMDMDQFKDMFPTQPTEPSNAKEKKKEGLKKL